MFSILLLWYKFCEKRKSFSNNCFLVESTKIEKAIFRQMEWGIKTGHITKNEVSVCFSLRTSNKELI